MSNLNHELFSSLIDQTEVALSTAGGRQNLPRWITENTRLPSNPHKNWSFKNHEYQIGILEDMNPQIAIQKASQVGCSELMVRMALALTAKLSGEHLMYILPTSHFAGKFVASRIDPVIAASPRLASLLSKKVDSNEIKGIASSFLHIGGAQNEAQAISVPARALFIDEASFCNSDVINVYASRLGHQREQDRIQVAYSTPLYPGSGVTEMFDQGSQKLYLCYHDACGHWIEVDTSRHIVLPGWDKPLLELTLPDLRSGNVYPDQAYVQCEHCHEPISLENLADPTRRAWVPKYPDRHTSSFQVDPLCAPAVRPPAAIVRSLNQYRTTARWVQFSIGLPFENAEGTITQEALNKAFTVRPISPATSGVSGAVAGLDQGKLAYSVNGKMVNGILEVFNMETFSQDGENGQADSFLNRFSAYNSIQGVLDAGPDSSLVKFVQNRTRYNAVWGCYFVRTARRASLELFDTDEATGLVKANRTAIIDEFIKAFNSGKIKLPAGHREEKEIRLHLMEPKRIAMPDSVGEEQATWVSKGPDHWAFALLYLYIAAKMVESSPAAVSIPLDRLVSRVKMKTSATA